MIRKLAFGVATTCAMAAVALLFVFAPVTARESTATPALWKIDGPAGDIYLFGSIHILPKGLKWRTPALDAALQQAHKLTFEIDIDAAKDTAAMMPLIAKLGFLPADQSLRKMLAPEHWTRLETIAKEYAMRPEILDRMRPWLVAMTLSAAAAAKHMAKGEKVTSSAAMEDLAGVDAQLWEWSKTANKERGALETAEDQLRVFADLPNDQQVEYLVVTLKQLGEPAAVLDRMVDLWKRGDAKALDEFMSKDMTAFPALRKALFKDRHDKWLPQIERMMSDGKTHVIVVGAGHLVGTDSVVDMLRKKGVKVEGP
jgi:hypothetical protein